MPSVVIQLHLSHYLEIGKVPLVHQNMLPLGRVVTERGRANFSLATPSQKDKLNYLHKTINIPIHQSTLKWISTAILVPFLIRECVLYIVICMCGIRYLKEFVLGFISLRQRNNSK